MPRVIWSSGNCMLYVRAGEPNASERGREANTREGGRRDELGKSLRKIAAHSGTGRSLSRDGRERKRAKRKNAETTLQRRGKGSRGEVREEEPRRAKRKKRRRARVEEGYDEREEGEGAARERVCENTISGLLST